MKFQRISSSGKRQKAKINGKKAEIKNNGQKYQKISFRSFNWIDFMWVSFGFGSSSSLEFSFLRINIRPVIMFQYNELKYDHHSNQWKYVCYQTFNYALDLVQQMQINTRNLQTILSLSYSIQTLFKSSKHLKNV